MATTSRETLLEKKVFMLERRLALVERFVELRFCETFRDFTIRNSDRKNRGTGDKGGRNDATGGYPDEDNDNDDTFFGDSFQEESSPTSSTKRVSRSTTKKNALTKKSGGPSSSSSTKKGDTPVTKDCVIRIVRSQSGNSKKPTTATAAEHDGEGESKDLPTSSRYGTRRQTRLAKQVKIEVDEVNIEADEDGGEMGFEDDGGNENGEDDYFSFPTEQNAGPEEGDGENNEQFDEHYEPNDTFEEVASESGSDFDEASEKPAKRKRKSIVKIAADGKKKFYCYEINRKRNRKRTYNNSSLSALSQETKIVSSDTSREECPICKRHYKKELIQQHINSHMRERTLQCPHCEKRYSGTNELRTHVKITHDREKYFKKCRHCGDAIVRKLILHEKYCVKKALKEGQTVDENLLEDVKKQCAANGLEFTLDDLETSFPPGVDPTEKLKCPHCKKYFQRRLFDRHVKMHSLQRNWKCSKCPKAYIHKHDLIRHMCSTHEASLECEICRKTFETRMDLCNHTKKCKKTVEQKIDHSFGNSVEEEVATQQTTEMTGDDNDDGDIEGDITTKQSEHEPAAAEGDIVA